MHINPNSKHRLSRLSLRQQKKIRVGAYQELGFGILFEFKADTSAEVVDQVLEGLLNTIEEQGANFSGYCNGSLLEGMVIPINRQKISAENREAIQKFLKSLDSIENLNVGEFVDAWH